ncbi:MAG: BrnT family toxin [Gammaproteobacteria bacterium]|nr:BrnT family toxin [Gammaproteobacteria bacterium]
MKFEWDEAKNAVNLQKHGIDFADVVEIFDGVMLVQRDEREDYGEERWIGIGPVQSSLLVVIYTERHGDTLRLISARKATKYEVRCYEDRLQR